MVFSVLAWHRTDRSLMTRSTSIAPRHRDVKTTFIQEHQACWSVEDRRQVIEERRTAFLIAFAGDQRFFYG